MKKIYSSSILLFPLFLWFFVSCEKGDSYYADFEVQDTEFDGTIYNYLTQQEGVYDSLLLVLDRVPELRRQLDQGNASLTLFAVTNRSFELAVEALNRTRKLTDKAPLYLQDVNLADLDSIVNRYALPEIYLTEDLAPFIDGQVVQGSNYDYPMHIQYRVLDASGFVGGGQQQLVFSDTNNSIFQRYWQRINTISVNIRTQNGVIHVLSAGHDFGFSKFTSKFSSQ